MRKELTIVDEKSAHQAQARSTPPHAVAGLFGASLVLKLVAAAVYVTYITCLWGLAKAPY